MKRDYSMILSAIRRAGRITENRETVSHVDTKGEKDFVTAADKAIQEYLRTELKKLLPEAEFFAEEDTERTATKGFRWILDPVDGTTNLMHDFLHYSVSLALAAGDEVIFGAVFNPKSGNMFYAVKGEGAYREWGEHNTKQERITVSNITRLSDALTTIGTSPYHKDLVDSNFKLFRAIFDRTQDIRRLGSAALDCCYVAASYNDIFIERRLQPWDYAAGSLIITEAGGRITDFKGNPPSLTDPSDILATNGLLHGQMLELIKEVLG
ncbi:MAG: inositol monophosphatase [Clostridia bacterium]|nr:inositol monophosphatase [Clostridia bacterium]